jgi:hypothetical protein
MINLFIDNIYWFFSRHCMDHIFLIVLTDRRVMKETLGRILNKVIRPYLRCYFSSVLGPGEAIHSTKENVERVATDIKGVFMGR